MCCFGPIENVSSLLRGILVGRFCSKLMNRFCADDDAFYVYSRRQCPFLFHKNGHLHKNVQDVLILLTPKFINLFFSYLAVGTEICSHWATAFTTNMYPSYITIEQRTAAKCGRCYFVAGRWTTKCPANDRQSIAAPFADRLFDPISLHALAGWGATQIQP